MLLHRSLTGLLGLLLVLQPAAAFAQGNLEVCRDEINQNMAREQRLYRSVLFGEPLPQDAPVGHVLYTQDGKPWIKVAEDAWETFTKSDYTEPPEIDQQSDAEIEADREIPDRRGIFQTKRTLTSELIPYLTQSMRAFDCKTQAICERVRGSLNSESEDAEPLTVQPTGCEPVETTTIPSCQLAGGLEELSAEADMRNYCLFVANELVTREIDLLKLAVEYDASYRSIIQFAGSVHHFLREFRWPLTYSFRQVLSILPSLERAPCFLGSCANPEQRQ